MNFGVLILAGAFLGIIVYYLFHVYDGQRKIAEMYLAEEKMRRSSITEGKNSIDAFKAMQAAIKDSQVEGRAMLDYSKQQQEKQLDLQNKTVFLLEQILAELRLKRALEEKV